MKSKKAMLILPVVAVALCAVALIGAGFAATYVGTTSNSGNEMDMQYITLSLGGESRDYTTGAFTNDIYYDTQSIVDNSGNAVTQYKVNGDNTTKAYTENEVTKQLVLLGTKTITVVNSNKEVDFEFSIASEDDVSNSYTFYVEVETKNGNETVEEKIDVYTNETGAVFALNGEITHITVNMYIDLTQAVNGYVSMNSPPSDPIADNVMFTFTATVRTA